MTKKLLIYIVAYNAKDHIESVLNDFDYPNLGDYEILVSDDKSQDDTSLIVSKYQQRYQQRNIKLVTQERNLGYGGNQKFGYDYAIKNGFDIVILIHGDGQYHPNLTTKIIAPLIQDQCDMVLGSRMLDKSAALRGGMPKYKFVGNIILTKLQNLILRQNLAEYHTGLKAYSVKALQQVDFKFNSDGFSFDTDIIIQFFQKKLQISEVKIPTFYGDEICRVNGVKYAFEVFLATILSRIKFPKFLILKKFR